ncbi:MAG: type II secretion system protein [Candidatus Woykebacteria bacterium]
MRKSLKSSGFTLIEIILVIALFSLAFGFILVSITRPKSQADIRAAEDQIYFALKEAQNLAMVGSTGGSSSAESHGVHFEQNKIVIFKGASYNLSDTANLETTFEPSISISPINLPSSNIIFSKLSGEVQNYSGAQNNFALTESNTGQTRAFTINQYGRVTIN